jgi:phage terminase large subunit-like protein
MDDARRDAVLARLTPEERRLFSGDWEAFAHEGQRTPQGPWTTWLLLGGRGSGKTRAGAEWLAARAARAGRLALVGPSLHDVREVMIDGPSGLRSLPGRERPRWEASRRRLVWTNGAVAYGFSAEDPESLRGPQFEAAWADEFCAWRRPDETLALLRMGLRRGSVPQLVLTTTPKPIPALRRLLGEAGLARSDLPTRTNAAHLSPRFLEGLDAIYGGTRLAAQELDGRVIEGEGALWTVALLDQARGTPPGQLDRVVVAVDPPASAGGDACGIVAVGRAGGVAHVLADRSDRGMSPQTWAERVRRLAQEVGAHRIVAEANQGGEMVQAVLAGAGIGLPIRLVHARYGKRARAEPVAALYEQGRVIHGGRFTALEEELMAMGLEDGRGVGSLDRADALVWAVTDLLIDGGGEGPRLRVL